MLFQHRSERVMISYFYYWTCNVALLNVYIVRYVRCVCKASTNIVASLKIAPRHKLGMVYWTWKVIHDRWRRDSALGLLVDTENACVIRKYMPKPVCTRPSTLMYTCEYIVVTWKSSCLLPNILSYGGLLKTTISLFLFIGA